MQEVEEIYKDLKLRECIQERLLTHLLWFSVQSLNHVQLFVTPWTAARQISLSITNSQSLLKLMSIKLVMPYNHLILCCPLLLLPAIFPSIRAFSVLLRWSKCMGLGFVKKSKPWAFKTKLGRYYEWSSTAMAWKAVAVLSY